MCVWTDLKFLCLKIYKIYSLPCQVCELISDLYGMAHGSMLKAYTYIEILRTILFAAQASTLGYMLKQGLELRIFLSSIID